MLISQTTTGLRLLELRLQNLQEQGEVIVELLAAIRAEGEQVEVDSKALWQQELEYQAAEMENRRKRKEETPFKKRRRKSKGGVKGRTWTTLSTQLRRASDEELDAFKADLFSGESMKTLTKKYGVGKSTIYGYRRKVLKGEPLFVGDLS